MKVYQSFKHLYRGCSKYHLEDMKQIVDYLAERGNILVSYKELEDLYYEFSDDRGAGWLGVHEDTLKDFEDWLIHYDTERYYDEEDEDEDY